MRIPEAVISQFIKNHKGIQTLVLRCAASKPYYFAFFQKLHRTFPTGPERAEITEDTRGS